VHHGRAVGHRGPDALEHGGHISGLGAADHLDVGAGVQRNTRRVRLVGGDAVRISSVTAV
jgi:hypothetical protein